MTHQEALAMQGTEFIYIFEDGDTMPAYVKKVDLEKMLISCWSFSLTTDQGYVFWPKDRNEEIEGACCLCAPKTWERINDLLTQIKETGRADTSILSTYGNITFSGCPL